ncbi:MAG: peptide chain release factor N(5)-glutamine methyltransferase [Caldilineaceae bacterium]
MAILQVNVRPAVPFRRSVKTQRSEDTDDTQANAPAMLHNEAQPINDQVVVSHSSTLARTSAILQKIVWRLMPFTTVGRALNSARERLDEAGCQSASLDAQVILAYVLGVERSWLFAHHEYALTAEEANAFTDLIARRVEHEPVAYLVGRKEFYGLDFVVDRRVLIPRPETELLVDAVLDYQPGYATEQLLIADVGTGSGAIALAVAQNCPAAKLYAIDLSPDALAVAQRNVERLDTRGQVTLLQGDLLDPLPVTVDVIVANLPYISSVVYPQLDADVRDYEPKVALESGVQGLDAITRLLKAAKKHLHPQGAIFLEIGHDQGEAAQALARSILPDATHISLRHDYHGRDRLVTIFC